MRFSSLSSGSSGNATFIASGNTKVLIDCGLPVQTLAARLASIGESLDGLDAVVCSHAHGDHIGGLARTVRERIRRGRVLPAYVTRPTAELIDWQGLERPPLRHFEAGARFEIGDLQVQSLSVSHDCADPVAFVATDREGCKAVVAVDMGGVPDALTWYARGAQIVLLESNHDSEMLRNSAYPEYLKKRITSDVGHLSNVAARNWIRRGLDDGTRHLVLAHLSRQNNLPALALEGATDALSSRGMKDCSLTVATYQAATEVIWV